MLFSVIDFLGSESRFILSSGLFLICLFRGVARLIQTFSLWVRACTRYMNHAAYRSAAKAVMERRGQGRTWFRVLGGIVEDDVSV